MRLEYDITPEDYTRFVERYNARSPQARREMQTYYFGVTTLAIGLTLVLHGLGYSLHSPVYTLWVFLFIAAYYYRRGRVQHEIRKTVQKAQKLGYLGKNILIISAEGVTLEYAAGRSERRWRNIARVTTEGPEVWFYLGFRSGIVVPASAFADDSQRLEFLEKVMQYREQAAGTGDAG